MKISEIKTSVQFYFHEESLNLRLTTTQLDVLQSIKYLDSGNDIKNLKVGNKIYFEGTPEHSFKIKSISITQIDDRVKEYGFSEETSEHIGEFIPYIFTIDIHLELI